MNDSFMPSVPVDGNEAEPIGGRDIVRRKGNGSLSPAQLESRSLIQRDALSRPEVDAFRELRTKLLAMTDGTAITLVVPVSSGSGGSFVSRNLAAALAFEESRTALLIDCDLRNPSQHTTLQVDPDQGGLVDYLDGPDAQLANLIYDTGMPGLQLLPAGNAPDAGGEYFSSFRMRLLLDTLRSHNPECHIFLDGPPVRGTPDARILAELADVVVLVAGYGRDTPAAIAQAAANFAPEKFAGVVFNEGV